ncbi:MAG: hypothetical protein JOZ54_25385 [Acidobacteria bacterium]|nr:hypothetical protein [Acidobacteriota bacterium]
MKRPPRLDKRLALGAVAGFAGTFLMQGMLKATGRLMPDAQAPLSGDAGEYMVGKLEHPLPEETVAAIPASLEKAAAKSLHMGYGMTSGMLYAAMRPRPRNAALEGAVLGLGVWAAGYLGWLPAAQLAPPIQDQTVKQVVVPMLEHVLFGIAVATLYDGMSRR